MIPIAALIVQQHGITVQLGNDQVSSAITIHVSGDQGARCSQPYLASFTFVVTSSKPAGPRLRRARSSGPCGVTTAATRSSQPSLSISIAVSPQPAVASLSVRARV